MFALIVVTVFVLIIAVIIYVEYRNEKLYQKERKKRQSERQKTKPPYNPKEKIQKPHIEKKEKAAKLKEKTPGAKEKISAQKKKESVQEEKISLLEPEEAPKEKVIQKEVPNVVLPECKYPKFNYDRLVKMGLSIEEADAFVQELIPQIETQTPLIKEALEKKDFHAMERLTHSIKGSSTTIGTGGISDLLVDFNTYLKSGDNVEIAQTYLDHLEHYYEALKIQFTH